MEFVNTQTRIPWFSLWSQRSFLGSLGFLRVPRAFSSYFSRSWEKTKPVLRTTLLQCVLMMRMESCSLPEGEENIERTFTGASPFHYNQFYLITKASWYSFYVCVHGTEEFVWIFVSVYTSLELSKSRKGGCLQPSTCKPNELHLTPESGLLGFKSAVSENLVGIADLVFWSLMPSLWSWKFK